MRPEQPARHRFPPRHHPPSHVQPRPIPRRYRSGVRPSGLKGRVAMVNVIDTGNQVEDIEERLAAAAARLRRHALTTAQVAELGPRLDALGAEVGTRRTALAA